MAAPKLEAHLDSRWLHRDVTLISGTVAAGQPIEGPQHAAAFVTAFGTLDRLGEALAQSGPMTRSVHRYTPTTRSTPQDTLQPRSAFRPRLATNRAKDAAAAQPFNNAAELARALGLLESQVEDAAKDNRIVVTLGGDHSLAVATISALSRQPGRLGVIWVDAHADFNTPETSPSANFHGMPLAALCGRFSLEDVPGFAWFRSALRARDVVLIGLRSADPGEHAALRRMGVRVYPCSEVHSRGAGEVITEALKYLHKQGTERLHLSFDIDALDASLVPGTGTPEPGGLTLEQASVLCACTRHSGLLSSMDLVEINPLLEGWSLRSGLPPQNSLLLARSATLQAAETLLWASLVGPAPRS